MTLAIIVLAVLLAAAIAALVTFGMRVAPGPVRTGHRVTVHTKQPDDQTIHGLLVREYSDRLELADATYVTAHGDEPIPGNVVRIPTANVSWLQEHS